MEEEVKKKIYEYYDYLENNDIDKIKYFLSDSYFVVLHYKNKRRNKYNMSCSIKFKNISYAKEEMNPVEKSEDDIFEYKKWYKITTMTENFKYNNHNQKMKLGGAVTHFSFSKVKSLRNVVVCPNCGSKVMLNKDKDLCCRYCHTILNSNLLKDRLTNFSLWIKNKKVKNFEKIVYGGVLTFFLVLFGLVWFQNLVIPIVLIYIVCVYFYARSGKKKNIDVFKVNDSGLDDYFLLQDIANQNKKLSVPVLKDNIVNKVMLIHFVDDGNEIRYFLENDLTNELEKNKNVVECHVIKSVITDYKMDRKYQYATLNMILECFVLNKRVEVKFENIDITVKKSISCQHNEPFYSKIFKCQSCGGNINIINNGVCPYCKSNIDFTHFVNEDWVITDYHSNYIDYT